MEEIQQAHAMSHPMTVRIPNVDAMSDEIQRLSAELAARTEHWSGIEFGLREEIRRLTEVNERLQKEREDAMVSGDGRGAGNTGDITRRTGMALLSVGRMPLDHRLGTTQPEGEPVAPMSGRRWMP